MTEDNGNGKITIAILGYRVDAMEKNQEKWFNAIDEKLDKILSCQNEQAKTVETHTNQIKTNTDEINRLRASSNWKEGLTGIGALIANILAVIGLKN